jgi:hypothetical protein
VVFERHLRIEARAGRERDREDRAKAVDGVEREETAMRWTSRILCGSVTLSIEPRPMRTSSSVTKKSGSSWICSSFSSSVIFASRWFTRDSTLRSAGCRVGWSACSSLDCVAAATTPPTTTALSARIDIATAALGLNLNMAIPL